MTTIAVSPSPSKIVYTPRPNYATNEIVWGFWITEGELAPRYVDWAAPTELMVTLARYASPVIRRTAAYQYYMPYADSMALRPAEVVEVEVDAESVQIDGRAWQVVDRMTTAELQAVAPRVAESWQRDGVVARCELRLARGGRRSYLARQYRDGSYSRPWRGSLTAAF